MEEFAFHGVLLATVCEAVELVNEHRRCPHFLRKLCTCYDRLIIEEMEEFFHIGAGLSKLYATINFGEHATVARTRVMKHAPFNPQWNESFHAFCAYEATGVTINVKDDHPLGSKIVGKAHIPASQVLSGDVIEEWYDLISHHHPEDAQIRGRILVKLQFIKVEDDPLIRWGAGFNAEAMQHGLLYSYFRQQKGNRVRLYQDAHVGNGFKPGIPMGPGRSGGDGKCLYEPARCWEDMYKAMSRARHVIYMAGWSVYTQISLVRDMERMIPGADGVTLGELLKRKAEEGVRVLLLVWDDRTSVSVLGVRTPGVMHTHDENTQAYFQGSKVHCVLCPRNPDDGASVVLGVEVGLMFTHHQKVVIVDVAANEEPAADDCDDGLEEYDELAGGDDDDDDGSDDIDVDADIEKEPLNVKKRKLVSFLGGIDLCDGRYDTPSHSLFRTLDSLHRSDFHQSCLEDASPRHGGPRQPWHDIHARVEGPCAWDILFTFEQRWLRQGSPPDALLPIKRVRSLWPPVPILAADAPDAWTAQILRSIDEGAVAGFPRDPDMASCLGLVVGKDNIIDRGIQDAYVCAIRRARRFVYIENQYFVGGSASWAAHRDAGALQLVPMELTLKILSKIEAGQRFAVYVVLPMWPEGIPESSSVQAILHWQRLTMETMYSRIAKALDAKGLSGRAKPTDYLNFFCLGNRETRLPVDDEYIIVGSANCNQRSLDGARDSEIAIGAFQPHYAGESPRGQVHAFRLSLWSEHLGTLHQEFLYPEALNCVAKVQSIAQHLWNLYTQDTVVDLPGHLLPYPILVNPNGDIQTLPGYHTFPDTKASVFGTHLGTLPPLLTV